MSGPGYGPDFMFGSRNDSLTLGAESVLDGNDSDDGGDLIESGSRKRPRVLSSSSSSSDDANATRAEGSLVQVTPSTSGPAVEETNEDSNNNDDDDDADDDERNTSGSSPVWMCAVKLTYNAAKCKICQKILQCNRGSTTSIYHHISNSHPKVSYFINFWCYFYIQSLNQL